METPICTCVHRHMDGSPGNQLHFQKGSKLQLPLSFNRQKHGHVHSFCAYHLKTTGAYAVFCIPFSKHRCFMLFPVLWHVVETFEL
jgi:hypothetical protein